MKKVLILIIFALFFLFHVNSAAIAACTESNAVCLRVRGGCAAQNAQDSPGTCTVNGLAGSCCIPATPTPSNQSNFYWGTWGGPGGQSSLSNFSNILGPNAPKNASKASWENVLSTIIALLILASVVLALAYLILGGFNWIFSGGDKQKLAKARLHVIYAIIGLLIVFLAATVISAAGTFFGIDFLNVP